jgi:predicted nucleotidyltransferase
MAEDGIGDYGQAKRKAARQLGAGESEALPSNEEVAIELRAYQSLYQDDEQVERLRELRLAALEVMELLADFRPYLTGAVLDGTAGRYAEVEIELFADSAKDVEIYLLSRNISYEIAESRQQRPDAPETRLRIEWQDATILLSVFPYQVERRQRRSPHSGRQHDRARTADVAALLAS